MRVFNENRRQSSWIINDSPPIIKYLGPFQPGPARQPELQHELQPASEECGVIVRGGEGVSKTAGDETMARKYDDDIMAEFSKIERMISEQVRLQTRTTRVFDSFVCY